MCGTFNCVSKNNSQKPAEIYPAFWKERTQIDHTEDSFVYFFYSPVRYCLFLLKEYPFSGQPCNENYIYYYSLKTLGQKKPKIQSTL